MTSNDEQLNLDNHFEQTNESGEFDREFWSLGEADDGDYFVGTVDDIRHDVGEHDQTVYDLTSSGHTLEDVDGENVGDVTINEYAALKKFLAKHLERDSIVAIIYRGRPKKAHLFDTYVYKQEDTGGRRRRR